MQGVKLNLDGMTFNFLTVLSKSNFRGNGKVKNIYWTCRCECGRISDIKGTSLVTGHSISCGCKNTSHKNRAVTNKNTLIKEYPSEYLIWRSMIARCTKVTHQFAKHYVLRGIFVCKEWSDNFDVFITDMGPRPSSGHSVDRKRNNEGYNKSNCRWATRTEQARNTRSNTLIEFNGEVLCLAAICEKYGISRTVLKYRLNKKKWDIEKALTTPVKNRPGT